jgi:UDP-glucuronate 4-epimerase
MKNILITGHKGYIGQNLWTYLSGDPDIKLFGLDFPDDITQLSRSDFPDVDRVIHLAAYAGVRNSINDPHKYFENNIRCAATIFKQYRHCPILHASSSSVKELKSPYSMTKYAIELMTKTAINMRFHTVWGGVGYRKDMLYGLALEDKLTFVTSQKRDYTRVEDVCSAIKLILDNWWDLRGQCIDIGYGHPISNVEFLGNLSYSKESLYKLPVIKNIEGVPESDETCADPSLLYSLGWEPQYGPS